MKRKPAKVRLRLSTSHPTMAKALPELPKQVRDPRVVLLDPSLLTHGTLDLDGGTHSVVLSARR